MSMVNVALLPRPRQALAENWWKLAHGVVNHAIAVMADRSNANDSRQRTTLIVAILTTTRSAK